MALNVLVNANIMLLINCVMCRIITDLLDDDIRDDIKCAKEIFDRGGLNAWKVWQSKCKSTSTTEKNKALPNLTNCQYK